MQLGGSIFSNSTEQFVVGTEEDEELEVHAVERATEHQRLGGQLPWGGEVQGEGAICPLLPSAGLRAEGALEEVEGLVGLPPLGVVLDEVVLDLHQEELELVHVSAHQPAHHLEHDHIR